MPASLAVATLIVCTFWGIASGLVGAVVVLMGVIAFNPMLKAGYDVKLASGVITAGGTLGILIPPSVMIIVYAAVAGQSIVKLYAAAMFPGFFLSFLYLIYIVAWAMINPKIAPPLPEDQTKVPVPAWLSRFEDTYRSQTILISLIKGLLSPSRARQIDAEGRLVSYWMLLSSFGYALVPFMIVAGTMATVWWYVVIHQQAAVELAVTGVQQLGTPELVTNEATPAELGPGLEFYLWFWGITAVCALLQVRYYWRFNAERLSVVKLLTSSTMPLGILTVVVLAVILFGHRRRARRYPVWNLHRDRVRRGWRFWGILAGGASPHAQLGTHQAGGVPDREDHGHGVLAVRRLGAVLGGVRHPRRSGAAGELGAVAQHDARAVHDPVAGNHLRAGLAAGMDRDHHNLRSSSSSCLSSCRC